MRISESISIQIGIVEFTEGASQPSLNKIETRTTTLQTVIVKLQQAIDAFKKDITEKAE